VKRIVSIAAPERAAPSNESALAQVREQDHHIEEILAEIAVVKALGRELATETS
jgi:hypothetical protein